jgi:hypothetical protein
MPTYEFQYEKCNARKHSKSPARWRVTSRRQDGNCISQVRQLENREAYFLIRSEDFEQELKTFDSRGR